MVLKEKLRRGRSRGRGEPRGRRHSPVVRAGPGAAGAGAPRHLRRARGGRHAPRQGADRHAALRHALPPLRDPRALHPAHVPRPAHARLSAAAQGRRAARVGRRSGRVPDRGRDAPRVLPRRARRHAPAAGCSSACTTARCGAGTWTRRSPRRSSIPCCSRGTGRTWAPATPRSGASDAVTMRKAWSVAPGPLRPEIVDAVEAELRRRRPIAARGTRTSWRGSWTISAT